LTGSHELEHLAGGSQGGARGHGFGYIDRQGKVGTADLASLEGVELVTGGGDGIGGREVGGQLACQAADDRIQAGVLDLGGRSGPAALDDEGAGRVQGTDAQADQDCSETCLVTQGSVDERRPARYVGHELRLDAHAGEGDGSRFGAALADAVPVPVNRHTGCCLGDQAEAQAETEVLGAGGRVERLGAEFTLNAV
jgi:hypothetical protein